MKLNGLINKIKVTLWGRYPAPNSIYSIDMCVPTLNNFFYIFLKQHFQFKMK